MNGKQKCNTLKQIRRDIAKANGITLDIPECTHKGDCPGTCPRCESEVRYLEREINERRRRGVKVALAGVSAGVIALNATACNPIETIDELINGRCDGDLVVSEELLGEMIPPDEITEVVLDGDIAYLPDTDEESCNDTACDTDGEPAVPGLLSEGTENFDDPDEYMLAGAIPFHTGAPEDTES